MAFDAVTYVLCKNYTNSELTKAIEGLSEGMKFKGSVATQGDLPLVATNGDLYIITNQKCKAVRYNNAWLIFDYQPTKVSQLENDSGFIDSTVLNTLATKAELEAVEETIPTKTSQLTNDSGFLTEHQSLASYRTSSDQDVIDTELLETISDVNARVTDETGKAVELGLNSNNLNLKLYSSSTGGELSSTSVSLPYRTSAAQDIIDAGKQSKLVAGSGIKIATDEKTISADVRTYKPFLSSWPTGQLTTKASFFDAVNASYANGDIKDGDAFLGHVDSTSFFEGAYVEGGGTLGSAEVSVQIMKSWGTGCVQLLTTTSSNNPPYHWEYTHVDNIPLEGWRCWTSNSYVQEKLADKQDKLTAGENITISADNVISATGGGSGGNFKAVYGQTTLAQVLSAVDANKSVEAVKDGVEAIYKLAAIGSQRNIVYFEANVQVTDSLVSSSLTLDANGWNTLTPVEVKQYSAGNAVEIAQSTINVKYDNDSIKVNSDGKLYSTSNAKLIEGFTTTNEVGGVPAGTVFAENTSLESIIKQILGQAEPVVNVKIYKGLTTSIPTTQAQIEALTLDQSKSKSDLLEVGYSWRSVTTNNQYVVLAVPKSAGIFVDTIEVKGFEIGFNETEIGDYYMYTEDNPVTLSAAKYVYKFYEE